MIHLVDVDETNWKLPLRATSEQELYVANTTTILARAYAYRNSRSRAFLVYRDDEPIEMGLYHDCEPDAYIFSELLIDKQFQGQGYGRTATKLVLELDGSGHYTTEQAEKDELRTKELEAMNLKVVRICNLEIDRNFRGVCEYIDLAVRGLSLSQLH